MSWVQRDKTLQETIGQKKIAFSYSYPGGTLKKIKQPKTLAAFSRKKSFTFEKRTKKMLFSGKSCRPE